MAKRFGFPLALVLLALALLLVRGFLERVTEAPKPAATSAGKVYPDYVMEKLHTRRYDAEGRLIRDLTAVRLTHYPDERGSLLAEPVLQVRGASGQPWHITAREGQSPPEEKQVRLHGDVRIDRPAGPDNDALNLRTEHLTVLPEQDYAETEAAVEITGRGMRTDGEGLKAWLDREELHILKNVRGHYEPKSDRPRP